jgi:hypothetical protein
MWIMEPVIIPTSVINFSLEKTAEIYPNPSKGNFNLSLSNFAANEKVSVTIFNLAGQAIYSSSYSIDGKCFKNVNVSIGNKLSPGNYYIVAKGNTNFARAKLMICK